MTFKHFIKKFKKDFSFRKKFLLFGGLGIVVLFGAIIATTSDSMFSSVLNLSQIAQQRKINFSQKQIKTQDTCVDTDWWKNYYEKGTITVVINWNQRVEQDSCNTNGTLRERFCGQPGEIGWLLRSENYVDCEYGCQNGACSTQQQWIPDAIIENIYITPNTNPTVGTNNIDNQINIVIKNIGNGPLIVPQELWVNKFLMECRYIWWHGWFRTIEVPQTIINANQSITTQLDIWFTNDIYNRYNSVGNRYIQCELYSQQQQWQTNPTPTNTSMLYESDGTNNSFTLNYTVVSGTWWQPPILSWVGDLIIDNIELLPNNTPQLYSDFSTNTFQVTVKNIGSWTVLLPMNTTNNLAIQIPFICYYSIGNGRIWSSILSTNILYPWESITTNLDMWLNPNFFGTLWQQSMMCEIISQQQQWLTTTDPNNLYMIYETNWSNNTFTTTYEVIWSYTPGDIIIENMYITPNTNPTLGTNNDTNKINLVMKNIWSGPITIPYVNWGNRFSLSCNYNWGLGWFTTTAVTDTILQPNTSTTVQITTQWYDSYDWFNTLWSKYIACTIITQQQQWWQSPNPTNTWTIYETDGTNNSFTLDYEVVSWTKSSIPSLREKLIK